MGESPKLSKENATSINLYDEIDDSGEQAVVSNVSMNFEAVGISGDEGVSPSDPRLSEAQVCTIMLSNISKHGNLYLLYMINEMFIYGDVGAVISLMKSIDDTVSEIAANDDNFDTKTLYKMAISSLSSKVRSLLTENKEKED